MKTLIFLLSLNLSYAVCDYEVGEKSLTWTGYKFTEKSPVSGSFNNLTFSTIGKSNSPAEIIRSSNIWIDTLSFESKKKVRNRNIITNLFEKIKLGRTINAHIKSVDPKTKTAVAHLSWGTNHYDVNMTYEVTDEAITLTGNIDLLEMGMKGPYESLAKACKAYHRGKDGKVMTWSEVKIIARANVKKTCS